jgi:hypothetical protein
LPLHLPLHLPLPLHLHLNLPLHLPLPLNLHLSFKPGQNPATPFSLLSTPNPLVVLHAEAGH